MGFYSSFFALIITILTGTSIASSIKIVRQGEGALVELLGKYEGKKLEPGLNCLVPFIEQISFRKTLKEQIFNLPPKTCVTLDRYNVTLQIVVYWRIIDLEKACYKVENLHQSMLNLLLTQIRTEIAKIELESLYTATNEINETLVEKLDIATESWGVKVTRIELLDFTIGSQQKSVIEVSNLNKKAYFQ